MGHQRFESLKKCLGDSCLLFLKHSLRCQGHGTQNVCWVLGQTQVESWIQFLKIIYIVWYYLFYFDSVIKKTF